MMTSTVTKIQKSDEVNYRSHMTQIQGSYCNGICRKHKSPAGRIAWSVDGVVYCRTCEIFLKKSGWFTQKRKKCKCCKHLVRSRPRQSAGKANFAPKKQGNIEWTDPEDVAAIARQEAREKQNRLEHEAGEESQSNKKSTPIFEEKVTEGKTYHEFRNFIEKEIKLQANYQLVMLKCLLTHKEVHKGKIAESLAHYNNKDPSDLEQVKEFLDKPVYKVLLESGFVVSKYGTIYNPRGHDYSETLYELNGKFSDMQHIGLHELLDQKIKEYNTQHDIQEFEDTPQTSIDWLRDYQNKSLLQAEQTIADLDDDGKFTANTDFDGAVGNEVRERQIRNREINTRPSSMASDPDKNYKENRNSEQKICPKCGKKANGYYELLKNFGHRGKRPQSWCRECRSNKNNNIAMEEAENKQPVESAKEFMQSTKQEKVNKIKEQLARLRAKLKAPENKQSSFPKAEAYASRLSDQVQTAEKEHDDILEMRKETDRVFSNNELSKKYKVGNMGGIRYSSKNNLIVLCDTKSGDFTDKIDHEFGLIAYTGEGRIGDQKMTGGNRRIYESGGQKTRIFYFVESESSGGKRGALDKNYRYFGQVKYVRHIIKTENDIHGNPRKTIKFLLQKSRLVQTTKSREDNILVLEPTVTTTKKSGGHKLKSCPICKKKVCPRLSKGHKLKSCPICKKKVCPRLWRVADGGRKK